MQVCTGFGNKSYRNHIFLDIKNKQLGYLNGVSITETKKTKMYYIIIMYTVHVGMLTI